MTMLGATALAIASVMPGRAHKGVPSIFALAAATHAAAGGGVPR